MGGCETTRATTHAVRGATRETSRSVSGKSTRAPYACTDSRSDRAGRLRVTREQRPLRGVLLSPRLPPEQSLTFTVSTFSLPNPCAGSVLKVYTTITVMKHNHGHAAPVRECSEFLTRFTPRIARNERMSTLRLVSLAGSLSVSIRPAARMAVRPTSMQATARAVGQSLRTPTAGGALPLRSAASISAASTSTLATRACPKIRRALAANGAAGLRTFATTPARRAEPPPPRRPDFKKLDADDVAHLRFLLGSPDSSLVTTIPAPNGEWQACAQDDLVSYNSDWMDKYHGHSPVLIKPKSTQEVSKVLQYCYQQRIAVVPQGGNTGLVGGGVPLYDELILSTEGLNQIRDFDDVSGASILLLPKTAVLF